MRGRSKIKQSQIVEIYKIVASFLESKESSLTRHYIRLGNVSKHTKDIIRHSGWFTVSDSYHENGSRVKSINANEVMMRSRVWMFNYDTFTEDMVIDAINHYKDVCQLKRA